MSLAAIIIPPATLAYLGYLAYRFVHPPTSPPVNANPHRSSPTRFRNLANGYEEEIGTPWLWCLLFGCIYFAVRGMWTHAVGAALLAIFTAGFSWLIYPFFARQIVETHYLRRGWLAVD
jgi:hypothetical protein